MTLNQRRTFLVAFGGVLVASRICMYKHPHFYHVTNEYLLLKNCIFHDFGILDLRTTEPFRSDSRTFFSNLRTFGLKNLRTHEPSKLRTFRLIGCNDGEVLDLFLAHTEVRGELKIFNLGISYHGSIAASPFIRRHHEPVRPDNTWFDQIHQH